ncbi:unnamed protein product [Rotaria magnacalcarata]|uniref:Uncharacterized protein n=1 Tax=Rotaria magnacalcarata TaxID=392030 RepID=A0A816LRP5_9BILA|nr:unnamed protein product [Rotaria magnacalcarata]
MAEFESPAVAKRELQVEFGEQTSGVNYIRDTFERFCETGTVEDRQSSGRTRTITEEKIDKVHDFIQDEPQSSVRTVVTACSIVLITAYRIMTENFSLKPYKVQFVQELYEEDLQDRVEMCETLIPMLENYAQGNLVFFGRSYLLFTWISQQTQHQILV